MGFCKTALKRLGDFRLTRWLGDFRPNAWTTSGHASKQEPPSRVSIFYKDLQPSTHWGFSTSSARVLWARRGVLAACKKVLQAEWRTWWGIQCVLAFLLLEFVNSKLLLYSAGDGLLCSCYFVNLWITVKLSLWWVVVTGCSVVMSWLNAVQLLLENAEMGCSGRCIGEFVMGWRIGCIG